MFASYVAAVACSPGIARHTHSTVTTCTALCFSTSERKVLKLDTIAMSPHGNVLMCHIRIKYKEKKFNFGKKNQEQNTL